MCVCLYGCEGVCVCECESVSMCLCMKIGVCVWLQRYIMPACAWEIGCCVYVCMPACLCVCVCLCLCIDGCVCMRVCVFVWVCGLRVIVGWTAQGSAVTCHQSLCGILLEQPATAAFFTASPNTAWHILGSNIHRIAVKSNAVAMWLAPMFISKWINHLKHCTTPHTGSDTGKNKQWIAQRIEWYFQWTN